MKNLKKVLLVKVGIRGEVKVLDYTGQKEIVVDGFKIDEIEELYEDYQIRMLSREYTIGDSDLEFKLPFVKACYRLYEYNPEHTELLENEKLLLTDEFIELNDIIRDSILDTMSDVFGVEVFNESDVNYLN